VKLGKYDIIEEVGRGGCAIVYRGRGPDGRDVAVKLLQGDAEDAARFAREERVHAAFGSAEGYVPLVDTGEAPEGPFLVMPFMRGGTLRDKIEAGPFEIGAAVVLARTLAIALGRAHVKGIVHRDMKPENVLYSSDGRPFIADLGLAKHFEQNVKGERFKTLTQQGFVYGSVGYMSPEQMGDGGSTRCGPPADVFALGAIVYECLAGRPAFSGKTMFAIVKTLANEGVEPLIKVRPEVGERLSGIIAKTLLRTPEARYADGNAFAKALSG
jgi:serine/threonine-protein kinase